MKTTYNSIAICFLLFCIAAVQCRPPSDQEKKLNTGGQAIHEGVVKVKAPNANTEDIALGIARGLLQINNAWNRAMNENEDIMSAGKEITEGLGQVGTGFLDHSFDKMQQSAAEFADGVKNVGKVVVNSFEPHEGFNPRLA